MKYPEMTWGRMEALINKLGGMDAVKGILSGTGQFVLNETSYLINTSKFTVNYDRTVADLLIAGNQKLLLFARNIADKDFFSSEKGEKEVEFGVFRFKEHTLTENVTTHMNREGFRPATMKELFVYVEKYPKEQGKTPIVALGSFVDISSEQHVCVLRKDGYDQNVYLYPNPISPTSSKWWSPRDRFLAVRK